MVPTAIPGAYGTMPAQESGGRIRLWWLRPRWWRELPLGRSSRPQNGDVWRLEAMRREWGMTHEDFANRVAGTPSLTRADLEGRYRSLKRFCSPGTPEADILRILLAEALGIVGLPWPDSRIETTMPVIRSVEDIWYLVVQHRRQQAGEAAYDEFTARTRLG